MIQLAAVIIMKNQFKGISCLLTATVIWGMSFIAQSVGMEKIGPFTFQAIRASLAVVFLFGCTVVMDLKAGTFSKWRDPKLWKAGLLCGIPLFVGSALQQIGLVSTDAGKAGFITALYIVLVPLLGLFIGKKPPKTAAVSVALAVAGLYLLSCVGVTGVNKGDLYVMGCALAFAVQIRFIDQMAQGLDGIRLNCLQGLVVVVLSVPFMFGTETIVISDITACWGSLMFSGVLSMGVAFTLQIVGQQHLDATPAALIMSLESVFAALFGWLILRESMTAFELTGCALVFAAVILSQIPVKKA